MDTKTFAKVITHNFILISGKGPDYEVIKKMMPFIALGDIIKSACYGDIIP